MLRLLVHWVLGALALLLVARVVPGIEVNGFGAALVAALVIGLVNATLGAVLHLITLPLAVLTLGIFWFVINALMLELASALVSGFHVRSFSAAFVGAILLSVVNFILRWLVLPRPRRA
jgi:putative membrane protein